MKLITIYSERLQLLLFWTYNKIPFLLSQFCSKLWKMWLKIVAQICPKRGKNNPLKISTKTLSMLLQINNIIMLKWLETLEDFLLDMIFLINPIDLKNLFKGLILNMYSSLNIPLAYSTYGIHSSSSSRLHISSKRFQPFCKQWYPSL